MNIAQVIDEVTRLRDHLYHEPEKYVRRFSFYRCVDYQVPLIRLIHLLSEGAETLRIQSNPEGMAIVDIVNHSCLCSLLEYDLSTQMVRFKSEASATERKTIAAYLHSRAAIIVD